MAGCPAPLDRWCCPRHHYSRRPRQSGTGPRGASRSNDTLSSPRKLKTADCFLTNRKKGEKENKIRKRETGQERHTKNQSNNENKSWNNPSFHDDDCPNRKRYRVRGTSVNTPPFNQPHGARRAGTRFRNGEDDFWSAHWWWREEPGNRKVVKKCAPTAAFVCGAGDERPGNEVTGREEPGRASQRGKQ